MSKSPSTNNNQGQNTPKNTSEFFLPPNKTGKKTLVLDLDETLVHSQFGPFDIPSDVVINIEIENEIHDIHVLVRPGVKEFLEKLSKKFEIVIFTASISKYAGPLLDILDKNKLCSYRLFREHCTLINTSFVKDLKKLGRDLKDVIIVDNSPMAYLLNNDNGLPILTWFDDKTDRELYKICPLLEFLSLVPDVRDYICKMVNNNEISYNSAMNVINDYNEMLKRKQKNENEKDENIIDNNNEISDSSENNLVFINKKNNNNNTNNTNNTNNNLNNEKRQQININIINNNITNYIYDNNATTNNKNQEKKENINNNINYPENKTQNNKFNPNSIIASVNRPEISQEIPSLSSLIKEQKKNKSTNSMKNISGNKEKNIKNHLNIKIGQHNTNSKIHNKKSESLGSGKIKIKRNIGENYNLNCNYNTNMNNYIKNSINNNNNKNTPIRKNTNSNVNTNYNSKSYNRKEIKVNNQLQKDNKNTKSAKSLKNSEKPNTNNKNIAVNKKKYNNKNNSNNKYESQIRLYNDGNMTTAHKKQKSLINFNVKDKTFRNNNKNNKANFANNLLHSVDLVKNDVNTFYHNENFPYFKQNNLSGGMTTKNQNNRNKFLKSGKIDNKKNNYSSSIEANQNKMNTNEHPNNNIVKNVHKQHNNININNNNFNYIKKKNNNKQFSFNRTLQQEKEKKADIKNDKIIHERNNNNNKIINEVKNINNNSAININKHRNLNNKLGITTSCHINQRSESMKNLNEKNKDISDNNKKKNQTNYPTTKRPKSSNIFKHQKDANIKKNEIKRNISGKNAKNIKSIKYDINEILERRGIAKSNRAKDLKGGFKYNLNNNYIFNYANINGTNRNKNNTIKKNSENGISIRTKENDN